MRPAVPAEGAPRDSLCVVRTCRGADGCPRAVGDVSVAAALASRTLASVGAAARMAGKVRGPLRAHHRLTVAISGCANQCSQPQIADFGLVAQRVPAVNSALCTRCGLCVETCDEGALSLGEAGVILDRAVCVGCGSCIASCSSGALRPGEEGWRVLAGGRLGRHPRLAADVASCVPPADAMGCLAATVDVFVERGRPGERIGATLDRAAGVDSSGGDAVLDVERRRSEEIARVLDPLASRIGPANEPPKGGERE